jgi:ATP adenylyltransferase
VIERGTLAERLRRSADEALSSGALQPIRTEHCLVDDHGVRFVVRILEGLARKRAVQREQRQAVAAGTWTNPFLPYEPSMFVADLSPTHVALLNKYNVIDRHLLIVTREYESQMAPLALEDLDAMWLCLDEIDGLAFYNGGETAGASQPHKHLQLVPLPLAPGSSGLPLDPLLASLGTTTGPVELRELPFRHRASRLAGSGDRPRDRVRATLELYRAMSRAANPDGGPYNLLATRRWMMLVPRSRECVASISINALGYAGALLVRDRDQLAEVRALGPMALLVRAGMPNETGNASPG